MTHSTKKKKAAIVSQDAAADVSPEVISRMSQAQIIVIPSECDATLVCMTVNGEPVLGFYSEKTNILEIMSTLHFEYLLDQYMKNYVNKKVKN